MMPCPDAPNFRVAIASITHTPTSYFSSSWNASAWWLRDAQCILQTLTHHLHVC
ncbi:hypothetical protein PISMIDRAFT_465114 [Pisolithus microcarpus 441]|uniref:Uncharacterized protein n=1 Tax=Pisolithus microcarpus 441 TaxID=765257 RepID=A0A0C9ZB91_9AGAM|nr:hypothetical protein PISMIDRAFT_465114 [Pisolithus microcarpus 441]